MLALQKKYMKIFYALKIFVILLGLSISVEAMSQSKKELKNENYSLKIALQKSNDTIQQMKNSIDLLNQEIVSLKNKLSILNSKSVSNELNTNIEDKDKSDIEKKRCKAYTLKGTQCSRNAQPNSDYCWQHQSKSNSYKNSSNRKSDKTIYTGPRGGKYYINSNGKKVYLRKK